MTLLSTTRLVIGAIEAPEGSRIRYYAFVFLGLLIVIVLAGLFALMLWIPARSRTRSIMAEDPNAAFAYTAGLADDGNEILSMLGASHSFRKPSHALVSFGATKEGLVVYRRFKHRIAFVPADRIEDVLLERRALASGPDYEVMSFLARDNARTSHRLSFSFFSPEKMYIIPYSQRYRESLLLDFRRALSLDDRAG